MRLYPRLVAASLVLSLAPCLVGAQVTRQPYLQVVTPTSIVVRWDTGIPEIGVVYYGASPTALADSVRDTAAVSKHVVTLRGLAPEQKYFYSIAGAAGGRDDQYAVTAPPFGTARNTRIWVVSDFGQSFSESDNVVRSQTVDTWKGFNGNSLHADFMLSLGDQTESDLESQLQGNYFNQLQDVVRNTPLFTIAGNHESKDGQKSYKASFSMPGNGESGGFPSGNTDYYSLTYGNVHVVALATDAALPFIRGVEADWLRNDLANNRSDWLIAILHRPMQSAGYHPTDRDTFAIAERQSWLPLLEAAGFDLILQGHNHVYERSYLTDNLVGTSRDFTPANKIDTTLGRPEETGPYHKKAGQGHAGTIFITCQGGGTANGADDLPVPYPFFPIVFKEDVDEGSLVIDVRGRDSMNVAFLCNQADVYTWSHIRDHFTIVKEGFTSAPESRATGIPAAISLRNYPNPFNPSTQITYDLPRAGYVRLVVYDILGRAVATLVDANQKAGTHTLMWEATDHEGTPLPGGMYIARIQSGTSTMSLKMMLLH